jgi:hypothetical protein
MKQVSDGKVTGVVVFLKAGSTNATIQKLWQGMPNTPGKEQEVVGVKVIAAASCTPRSRRCRFSRGPKKHYGPWHISPHRLENANRMAIPRPKPREYHIPPGLSKRDNAKQFARLSSGIINCDQCQVKKARLV